jgi:hypothetical protein
LADIGPFSEEVAELPLDEGGQAVAVGAFGSGAEKRGEMLARGLPSPHVLAVPQRDRSEGQRDGGEQPPLQVVALLGDELVVGLGDEVAPGTPCKANESGVTHASLRGIEMLEADDAVQREELADAQREARAYEPVGVQPLDCDVRTRLHAVILRDLECVLESRLAEERQPRERLVPQQQVTESVTVPVSPTPFDNCLKTEETSPLEPDVIENKFYADGVGNLLTIDLDTGEKSELVQIIHP